MPQASKTIAHPRIVSRDRNVVAVDFTNSEPPPRFPGAAAADHPAKLSWDDPLAQVALANPLRHVA